jgi:hypothetical protein
MLTRGNRFLQRFHFSFKSGESNTNLDKYGDIRQLLDELEANRKSRRTAWSTLQRLRKFLEANGARISIPDDRTFETEGEAIPLPGRTIQTRCMLK